MGSEDDKRREKKLNVKLWQHKGVTSIEATNKNNDIIGHKIEMDNFLRLFYYSQSGQKHEDPQTQLHFVEITA